MITSKAKCEKAGEEEEEEQAQARKLRLQQRFWYNKATLRSKVLGSKASVLSGAKMPSVHLCLQLYFSLTKETLSTVCRNMNMFLCPKTPGADNKTTREG